METLYEEAVNSAKQFEENGQYDKALEELWKLKLPQDEDYPHCH